MYDKTTKNEVKKFWDNGACGEELYLTSQTKDGYTKQATRRYELEPYILPFADFIQWKGKNVLEIGVGLGADHSKFAENGANLWGIDLTNQALHHTHLRFKLFGLNSTLCTGDAEQLEFPNGKFDLVYSWGVIHHSPDTKKAASEILRILRPGGEFRIMVYNKYSMIGYMLWLRYALLAVQPFSSLDYIYSHHPESPGTKAYTKSEAAKLFPNAKELHIETVLTHGDLLESNAGQKHQGFILTIARALWPRALIKLLLPNAGLFMLIKEQKSS